eukprot:9246518-Pyramimonas_sp.AAC.1
MQWQDGANRCCSEAGADHPQPVHEALGGLQVVVQEVILHSCWTCSGGNPRPKRYPRYET